MTSAGHSRIGGARIVGFTLVEMLIALSLLSLLMLVLTGAMRTMGQTEERIEQRFDQADRSRVAIGFLRDVLAHASARPVARTQGPSGALFDASAVGLAWVGVMPARYGLGGRHFMRLGLEPDQGGAQALVLRYVPWGNQPQFPDWSQADAQVIVPQVAAASWRYLDARNGRWAPQWPTPEANPRDALPGAIELHLQTVSGEWPPLVVRMAALAPTDPDSAGFTIGGRR